MAFATASLGEKDRGTLHVKLSLLLHDVWNAYIECTLVSTSSTHFCLVNLEAEVIVRADRRNIRAYQT